jgi:hypothetical protein
MTPLIIYLNCTNIKTQNKNAIQPYKINPRYWQYNSEPVLLIGGSKEDNIFQIPDLKQHLNLLATSGGNYIRNTMSARDLGNEQAFKKLKNSKYDLNHWNNIYWQRFENFLRLTEKRNIIVQIEIWAQYDFSDHSWDENPWNPKNNINYSYSNTILKEKYGRLNTPNEKQEFFQTVPSLRNDRIVLEYQNKFVDKILSISLRFNHVLYCITNEILKEYSPEWGWYWAKYINKKAAKGNRLIFITEMFQDVDIRGVQHKASLDHPEIYSYIELSQNTGGVHVDDEHWDNLMYVYNYVSNARRPINHIKTYGGDKVRWTLGDKNGLERFWRSIIGGGASMRFHRPPHGLGLNEKARASLRSVREIEKYVKMWEVEPYMELLFGRDNGEAYLSAALGDKYIIYFPDNGAVQINFVSGNYHYRLKWLNILNSKWVEKEEIIRGNSVVRISTPHEGSWIALLLRK